MNESTIVDECHDMVYHLRENYARTGDGFELRMQTKRESINVLMRLVCGFRYSTKISKEFEEIEASIATIFESISAGNPSDYIPLAKFAPSTKVFVDKLKAATAVRDKFIDGWIAEHKQ